MDIDIELFKIIKKYDIYRYIPEAEAVYMTALAFRLLEDKILNYPEEAVIAMRGGGIHFKKMWELMTEKAKRRIAYIFDRNINGDLCIPIIDPDEIDKYHIDVIILASWKFRDEFIDEFMERKGQYEIVDPYEYWMENGLRFYCEFYNEPAYQHLHVTYVDINRSLFLYRTTKNDNAKKYNLEKAIAQCIEVKNFIYVEKYVREYIGNGWDSDNRIKQFFNDIHNPKDDPDNLDDLPEEIIEKYRNF